jgi:hypothetical protein
MERGIFCLMMFLVGLIIGHVPIVGQLICVAGFLASRVESLTSAFEFSCAVGAVIGTVLFVIWMVLAYTVGLA